MTGCRRSDALKLRHRRGLFAAAVVAPTILLAQAQVSHCIDTHQHLSTPAFIARLEPLVPLAPLQSRWTVEEMDSAGISTAMLSVTSPGC